MYYNCYSIRKPNSSMYNIVLCSIRSVGTNYATHCLKKYQMDKIKVITRVTRVLMRRIKRERNAVRGKIGFRNLSKFRFIALLCHLFLTKTCYFLLSPKYQFIFLQIECNQKISICVCH